MKRVNSIAAIALTGLVGFSTLSAPIAASASEEGQRNTAIGLGALAAGLLLTQHNKLPGLLAAGGAAYAFSQIHNDGDGRYRSDFRRTDFNDYRNRPNDSFQFDGNRDHRDNRDKGGRDRQDNNRNDRR